MDHMLGAMIDKRALGADYRRCRALAGKTQRDVAAEVGVTYQYISAVELGKENPTLETLENMAKAVLVTVEVKLVSQEVGIRPIDRLTDRVRGLSDAEIQWLAQAAEVLPKTDESAKGSAMAGLEWAAARVIAPVPAPETVRKAG